MTLGRIIRRGLAGLLVLMILAGLLRAVVWATGTSLSGPALLDGPHVTVWDLPDPAFEDAFGGVSGLLIEGDILLAASDRGTLFDARVLRDPDGWLTAPTQARMITVPLLRNWPATEAETDLEGLTRLQDGRLILAYERFARIDTLDGLDATPRPTHVWTTFQPYFGNTAFEAVATLPDGRVLAILEGPSGAASTQSYLWNGERGPRDQATGWSAGADMPLSDGFVIVGADMGADGCLYLLDRKFTLASGFSHRLRRVASLENSGETIYTSAPAVLGNAEGLSMEAAPNGDLIATLITDNNFLPLTPTQLIQYRLTPSASCDGVF
ncbi:esterase-like activity of phytase family protein [Octadecabacter sp. 1_MG-2023]|uniref:esterase-like activity of phytase family protein n=1 Tax=unclassified Octadecabacter TaxID=196158 RepID=UPI001C098CD9|nr:MULTISPECIES: esterase-like activity of phytase family protein [unclassified Octadecabacter]MBU2993995.1 esterase-like activity of phytase family protein [Octadecabacter sp. B2R22]MDO6736062.1 esterase-like activity of phytase family protein [Octadecabacter sp. 1_MG-2023]